MKKSIIKTTLPTASKTYDSLDIVGQTFGRYFDYKRETAMIKYETQKVKKQAQIIVKQIDAELKKSLDSNDKSFRGEMFRLKAIAKDLKDGSKKQKLILKHISELTGMLSDSAVLSSVKEQIPQLIAMAHQQLNDERNSGMQKLNLMSSFDPNQKSIKGE